MSRTLNTHVTLWGSDGALVTLAPGDALPEWAAGKVGGHCLAPEAPDAELSVADADDDPEVGPDLDAETDDDEAGANDEEPEAPDAAPDFTAPAPRRNSRSRK